MFLTDPAKPIEWLSIKFYIDIFSPQMKNPVAVGDILTSGFELNMVTTI